MFARHVRDVSVAARNDNITCGSYGLLTFSISFSLSAIILSISRLNWALGEERVVVGGGSHVLAHTTSLMGPILLTVLLHLSC